MTIHVAVIGAGQLGSRHLQALAMLDRAVSIQVVDPCEASRSEARSRFCAVAAGSLVEHIDYLPSLEQIAPALDVALVATSANVRRAVVESLLERTRIRYLVLEKFLFPALQDYEPMGGVLAEAGTRAWVNCPRRMWPVYEAMQRRLQGQRLRYQVTGSRWGMGSNGIHFLDHFAYLTGQRLFELDWQGLQDGVLDSKRQGFVEFSGCVRGQSDHGHQFSMASYPEGDEPIEVVVSSDEVKYYVNETRGTGWVARRKHGWTREPFQFTIPYQSQLTHTVVQQLLDHASCPLTPFSESADLHVLLLEAYLDHYRKYVNPSAQMCHIT